MRRPAKISIAVAGTLSLLGVALIATVFVAGNTQSGRALIERLTDRLSSGHVRMTGLGGSFPEHLTLAKLQLSDDRGIWLRAERITVRWRPLELLRRIVRVEDLHAERVDIARTPSTAANSSASRTSIPRIDVLHASIDVLRLEAQLAGSPASLSVHGSAHMRSLDDLTTDLIAQRIDGDGRYSLHLLFDRSRVEAALQLHEPAGGPLANLLRLPGLGALSVAVDVTGPRTLERIDMAVDAGSLRARAHGSVNLSARSGNFDYSLEAPAMRPRPDIEWQHIASTGHFNGSLLAPNAEGSLQVAKLRVAGGIELAALQAQFTAAGGSLRLHALLGGLAIPGPNPNLLGADPIDIVASLRLSDPARPLDLLVTQRLFALHAHVATAGPQSAVSRLTLPNIAPFAALIGQDVHGGATVDVELKGGTGNAETRFSAGARAALTGGTAPWLHLFGDRASLKLSGTFDARDIDIAEAQATGRAWSMAAAGTARRRIAAATIDDFIESMQAHWTFNIADLSAWSAALAGNLTLSGQINGRPAAFGGDMRMTCKLAVRGGAGSTVAATLRAQGLPYAPTGALRIGGNLDGAPLELKVAFARTPRGYMHAVIGRSVWKSAVVDGDLTLHGSLAQTQGKLRLAIGNLADLNRLLNFELQGQAEASAAFAPLGGLADAAATHGPEFGRRPIRRKFGRLRAWSRGCPRATTLRANGELAWRSGAAQVNRYFEYTRRATDRDRCRT